MGSKSFTSTVLDRSFLVSGRCVNLRLPAKILHIYSKTKTDTDNIIRYSVNKSTASDYVLYKNQNN